MGLGVSWVCNSQAYGLPFLYRFLCYIFLFIRAAATVRRKAKTQQKVPFISSIYYCGPVQATKAQPRLVIWQQQAPLSSFTSSFSHFLFLYLCRLQNILHLQQSRGQWQDSHDHRHVGQQTWTETLILLSLGSHVFINRICHLLNANSTKYLVGYISKVLQSICFIRLYLYYYEILNLFIGPNARVIKNYFFLCLLFLYIKT